MMMTKMTSTVKKYLLNSSYRSCSNYVKQQEDKDLKHKFLFYLRDIFSFQVIVLYCFDFFFHVSLFLKPNVIWH